MFITELIIAFLIALVVWVLLSFSRRTLPLWGPGLRLPAFLFLIVWAGYG